MSHINGARFFVTGIGTDVGKTVVSSILTGAVSGLYWKPIQCGLDGGTDKMTVRRWSELPNDHFVDEKYCFQMPASPHLAAKAENVQLSLQDFSLPISLDDPRNLVVEGAGGVMVPLNEKEVIGDFPLHLGLTTVLVTAPYLGAYNHTLLTVEALRRKCVSILGIVVTHLAAEESDPAFNQFIEQRTGLKVLLELPYLDELSANSLRPFRNQLKRTLESEEYYGKIREQSVAPFYPTENSSESSRLHEG